MMTDKEGRDLMVQAYATAMRASHESGCVAIHVGQDFWDWAEDWLERQIALGYGVPKVAITPGITTIWGFPLVLDPLGRPDAMSVHVIKIIR